MLMIFSGNICSGKTSIAEHLETEYGYRRVRTSNFLKVIAAEKGLKDDRDTLQRLGNEQDRETSHQWIIAAANEEFDRSPGQSLWIFDSVRKIEQLNLLRSKIPEPSLFVFLSAPEHVRRERFESRTKKTGRVEAIDFDSAVAETTESRVGELRQHADKCFDTSVQHPDQIAKAIVLLTE